MKNEDVVKCFLNRRAAVVTNLRSTGDALYSYNTCIAEFDAQGTLYINATSYSVTSSKHRNYVRKLSKNKFNTIEVKDILQGTRHLLTKVDSFYKRKSDNKYVKVIFENKSYVIYSDGDNAYKIDKDEFTRDFCIDE